jgi:cytochrome bd-type quinol oxidase subunit 2
MPIFKLLVVLLLIAIVVSLGSALFQLARGTGDSHKLLRALTWRISLSVALFALLLLAYRAGWIAPHAVTP